MSSNCANKLNKLSHLVCKNKESLDKFLVYYVLFKEISPWKKHKKTLLFEYGRVLKLGFLLLKGEES